MSTARPAHGATADDPHVWLLDGTCYARLCYARRHVRTDPTWRPHYLLGHTVVFPPDDHATCSCGAQEQAVA